MELLTMRRHKAARSFYPHKWEPHSGGGNLLILEGATRPLHPQAMHLDSCEIQPHDVGVPCLHGDIKCLLGDRMVMTSPSVVMENFSF